MRSEVKLDVRADPSRLSFYSSVVGYCSDNGAEGQCTEVPNLNINALIDSSIHNSCGLLRKKNDDDNGIKITVDMTDDIIQEEKLTSVMTPPSATLLKVQMLVLAL